MRYIFNFILLMLPPTRFFSIKRYFAKISGIKISDGVCINGYTSFFGKGNITIGKNTWIGLKNSFYCTLLSEIKIGANCDIGPDVSFVPGSHRIGDYNRRAGKGIGGDIIVEDGCWIGSRVTILGGVTIGQGSIVGAGSLVNKNIPANTIYAGVPAALIRKLDYEKKN